MKNVQRPSAGDNRLSRLCGFLATICILTITYSGAATYYVATTGNDANPGTITQPFATLQKGADVAVAGDTVFIRGGTYALKGAGASSTSGISITKSGQSGTQRIYFWAYNNEKPVFDFSGLTLSTSTEGAGITVTGSWLYFKGLEVCNVPEPGGPSNRGIYTDGAGNNIFELMNIHNNGGPGFFISHGTGGNLVLNCDSHDNYDPNSSQGNGQNADGFGCHYQVSGTSTIFRGCRSWWNSDDGYDCINQGVAVYFENCWAMRMGYYNQGATKAPDGNGNGFKAGGWGMPPSWTGYTTPIIHHVVENCVSLLNSSAGFYENHQPTSDTFYNNSAYNNGADYNMLGYDLTTDEGVGMGYYRNNVAYLGEATSNATGDEFNAAYNSWDITGLTVAASDFASLDTAGIMGPRNADGSVPNVEFLRLSATSKLIDAGTDVGLPYVGKAPDLGAFEYGATGAMPSNAVARSESKEVFIHQTGATLFIRIPDYQTRQRSAAAFSIFNAQGRQVGTWRFASNELSVSMQTLPRGIYVGRINDGTTELVQKVLLR
ncbi:MAG: right-handed parallel beta-helix repeat-containing protein [Chitinispirillaceae bacterium]